MRSVPEIKIDWIGFGSSLVT